MASPRPIWVLQLGERRSAHCRHPKSNLQDLSFCDPRSTGISPSAALRSQRESRPNGFLSGKLHGEWYNHAGRKEGRVIGALSWQTTRKGRRPQRLSGTVHDVTMPIRLARSSSRNRPGSNSRTTAHKPIVAQVEQDAGRRVSSVRHRSRPRAGRLSAGRSRE